jgi:prevent-host-death family protein
MQNVSAHDAKARFGQLLDTARREPVVIERHGRAVAVVFFKEDFDELNAMKLERLRTEIAAGVVAVERGEYKDYDEENLMQLGEHIKVEGRKTRSAK